ncbi:MAG: alpha/beta hydrolase [Rhodospirillales bacterium]
MSISLLKTVGIPGGRRLGYREDGKGVPVMLLHGLGPGSQSWEHQFAGLRDKYRVIAWDMPGYGGSDPLPAESPKPTHYAADLAALMDALKIQKAHVLGQSVGAIIAACFAHHYANRVLSLVLTAASSGSGTLDSSTRQRTLNERLDALAKNGPDGLAQISAAKSVAPGTKAAIVDELAEHISMMTEEGYNPAVHMLVNSDIYQELGHVKVPTLVMCGTADPVTPEPSVRKIAEQIPKATFRRLPGLGHCAFIENPEMYNTALRDHLGGATRA